MAATEREVSAHPYYNINENKGPLSSSAARESRFVAVERVLAMKRDERLMGVENLSPSMLGTKTSWADSEYVVGVDGREWSGAKP